MKSIGIQRVGLCLALVVSALEAIRRLGDDASVAAAAALGSIAVMVTCAWGALQMLRERRADIWTPLPWWLLTSSLYFGFGGLAVSLANDASRSYIWQGIRPDDADVLRAIQLNACGLMALLFGYGVIGRVIVRAQVLAAFRPTPRSEYFWLRTFALVGVPVYVLGILPLALGMRQNLIPESINILGNLCLAALALLAGRVVKSRRASIPAFVILFATIVGGGLLSYSKLTIVFTLLVVLMGVYRVRGDARGLGLGLGLLVLVYWLAVPLVDFGREASRSVGDLSARTTALQDYMKESRTGSENDVVQRWWTRLCYAPVQVFVMREYDEGRPGGTFDTVAYGFIPRILFPEKPLVTQGDRLTYLMFGSWGSMTSPTVVGECYWAGGWLLVAAGGIFIGLLFRGFRELITPAIETQNLGILAFSLVAVRMGLRPDDYFVATFIISLPILVFFLWTLRALSAIGSKPGIDAARRTESATIR